MISDHSINTLIIQDHPLLFPVLRDVLIEIELLQRNLKFAVAEAADHMETLAILERMEKSMREIDLVLLDIDVRSWESMKYFSGDDIGAEIRSRYQKAKFVISTTHKNSYRIRTSFNRINPEGFFIKSDMNREALMNSIISVLQGEIFYSSEVLKFVRRRFMHDIGLDEVDIRILYELSQGSKVKDLPQRLPFSLAAIEKRKQRIKAKFDLEDANDRQLFDKAREYGFI